MKTDDLIQMLARDAAAPRASMPLRLGTALAIGGAAAVVLFAVELGTRPDLGVVAGSWRFQFKLVVPIVAFLAAFWACVKLTRPDCELREVLPALLVGPVLTVAGAVAELILTPAGSWESRALGRYSAVCLVAIPSLSAVSLVAALAALRLGAPRSPQLAGAVAGLLAATLSASIYATHCPDDSPLFFALWYATAIAVVVIVGLIAGQRVLRW